MAGFEIAGVVLGSIPLIISALEHYSDGISTIKSMQKYQEVFEYLHASFVTSLAIYRNTCEELLSPLALSDAHLYKLLEEVDTRSWDDAILDANLRNRLGTSHLPFKSSLRQINKKIRKFADKLRLDSNLRPPWVSQTGVVDTQARSQFFRNPLTRIKGGFNSEKYKELLSSLHDDISRIQALTSGAIALEPLRLERKIKASSSYWNGFHVQARTLYEILDVRWSSQCVCQCRHQANLRLEIQKGLETNQSPTFKFLFSFDISPSATPVPWRWRAVEIEPCSGAIPAPHPKAPVLPQPVVSHSASVQSPWSHCLSSAPLIKDLCEVLTSQQQQARCLGILNDTVAKHHLHSLKLPKPNTSSSQQVTLQQLLESRSGSGFGIKEKSRLALTLACAVLQLHDTPWLAETWTMKDIYLMDPATSSLLADQPYVSKSFTPKPATPSQQAKKSRFIRNSTVFALGVTLLEISYGQPLSAFTTPDDLDDNGNRTSMTQYFIADRLAENIHLRELRNYSDAVRRCVYCTFDCSAFSLTDDDFRERFYQGVVVPLQKDYEYVSR
ncbi:hypothetical protein BCR34DRAFT_583855 [Clohesyomyces aquaticus]|uniref:DUF7580 domain-containing protein n=1 Tax=Clohesyomyces aquaticus TaxID=1231657 RepID=A0A1Y2A3K3_9PLEO|nr:hypothetical protein BCR34DRAFT_583855 [Clohesyomyces aquaticus]